MAIFVTTQTPKKLLSSIKQAISEDQITTWSIDGEDHFTHSAQQWARHAWFKARIEEKRIVFNIIPPKGKIVSRAVYGIYHGRFIEMLLNHFDGLFERASATAMPTANDRIRSRTAVDG